MGTLWNTKRKKSKKEIRLKKEIHDRSIRDVTIRKIKALFEQQQQEHFYKPKRVSNFYNDNYNEYESNDDRNWYFSLDEYNNKIEPYFRHIIIDLQNSETWKIQWTFVTN